MATERVTGARGPIVDLPAGQLAQLEALLRANALPADDCAAGTTRFFAIFEQRELIAAGGLERAAPDCLLRSLVVDPRYRGRGLGRELCEFLLRRARAEGCRAVYLLTESAAGYFAGLGFTPVKRAAVPAAIAATRQFASLCPDSASCLMLPLARE